MAGEHDAVMRAMDVLDSQAASDLDDPSFAAEKNRYQRKRKRRAWEHEEIEETKRKVCAIE